MCPLGHHKERTINVRSNARILDYKVYTIEFLGGLLKQNGHVKKLRL